MMPIDNYKVICYTNGKYTYDESFEDMKSAIKRIYEKLQVMNLGSYLATMTVYPTYTALIDALMFKRSYIRVPAPNMVFTLMKIAKGDIDEPLMKYYIEEIMKCII